MCGGVASGWLAGRPRSVVCLLPLLRLPLIGHFVFTNGIVAILFYRTIFVEGISNCIQTDARLARLFVALSLIRTDSRLWSETVRSLIGII